MNTIMCVLLCLHMLVPESTIRVTWVDTSTVRIEVSQSGEYDNICVYERVHEFNRGVRCVYGSYTSFLYPAQYSSTFVAYGGVFLEQSETRIQGDIVPMWNVYLPLGGS